MVHDSTPCRTFKISELTRLIATQLVFISRKSAVNLACACRSLEEPVLSTLWETQSSLCTLLEVFPEKTWEVPKESGEIQRPRLIKYVVCGLGSPLEGLKA